MNTNLINQCIRCGKPRIISKTWHEGDIIYSTSVCPDSKCQEIVEQDLKRKRDRLNAIKDNSLKRRMENKRNRKT